jgi:hypothetical protein
MIKHLIYEHLQNKIKNPKSISVHVTCSASEVKNIKIIFQTPYIIHIHININII